MLLSSNAFVIGVETFVRAGGVYAWNGEVRARDAAVQKGGGVAGEARTAHGKASFNKTVSRADA